MGGLIGAGGVGVNVSSGVETYTFDPDALASLGAGLGTRRSFLLSGSPSSTLRTNTADRLSVGGNLSALTTQVMLSVAIPLEAGDVVTNLTFVSGDTQAGTPTNWWFALYDTQATPAKIAQTADQTSTAWAANTVKTVALTAPYTVVTAGVYYAAVMVKATTPPTLVGVAVQNAVLAGAVVTGQKVLAQTSGASLTTTAPSTIATPTTVANVPYVIAT
jgi:hypothetical protein